MDGQAVKALSDSERERVAEIRERVYRLMPEIVPCIAELHKLGLIDGWRSVAGCWPSGERPPIQGVVVRGPFLRGDEFCGGGT